MHQQLINEKVQMTMCFQSFLGKGENINEIVEGDYIWCFKKFLVFSSSFENMSLKSQRSLMYFVPYFDSKFSFCSQPTTSQVIIFTYSCPRRRIAIEFGSQNFLSPFLNFTFKCSLVVSYVSLMYLYLRKNLKQLNIFIY